jgi:PAS domain S-box-containing protein
MKMFARMGAAVAGLIGTLVLVGWLADWEVCKEVLPGLVAMNPATAVCFIMSGVSLWLLGEAGAESRGGAGVQIARACAAVVAFVGLLKFGGDLLGRDAPVDQILFAGKLAGTAGKAANRMAPNTALCFLLIGLALLFLDWRTGNGRYPAQFLSLAVAALSSLALMGYVFGVTVFYRFASLRPMALNTALGFLALVLGLLGARPGRGVTRVLFSQSNGGTMMRRLLPTAVIVPLALGLVWRAGERAGYFGAGFSLPLTVVSSVAVFLVVLYFNANWLDQADEERRRAEAGLRQSAEQLQRLYNQAPCGYHSLDADGGLLAMNDTELSWLGYRREEVVGRKRITDLLTPDSRERFRTMFPKLKERGEIKDVEFDFVRRDGSVMPVLLNATAVRDEADGAFSTRASVFDISARKRAEEERNRFFTLSLDLFCIAGFDGYFKTVNQSWEKVLGYTSEELLAVPYLEFIHPDDRPATSGEAERNSQGRNAISFANRYRCKDGSYRWFLWNATPVVERGLIYAVARDITEQKRVEDSVRQLNEDLRERTAQLEILNQELEAFSYSVSHDLRAPVRHISGFVDLLSRQDVGSDPKTHRYLKFIAESARQMGELVDDLLSFSRMARTEMHVGRVPLAQLVAEARRELADSCVNRSVTWRVEDLPEVTGDAAMLRLVFVNLLANAIKYTGRQPHAEIEVGSTPGTDENVVFVRDNGVGFDMKYVDKLFGVFQRLHRNDEFEGTGIGLANVRRIIHRHGGRTWAVGEIGRGATFYFSIPRQPCSSPENNHPPSS